MVVNSLVELEASGIYAQMARLHALAVVEVN